MATFTQTFKAKFDYALANVDLTMDEVLDAHEFNKGVSDPVWSGGQAAFARLAASLYDGSVKVDLLHDLAKLDRSNRDAFMELLASVL